MTHPGACSFSVASWTQYKFTGKERDTETGWDYFGARYYGSIMGRFTSPDPKILTSRHIIYPQKWNKYAYVQNNPLALIDPNGLDDFRVFMGPGSTPVDWGAARAAALANGHTFKVFEGTSGPNAATVENWNTQKENPNARMIFVGHSTLDPDTGIRTGIVLENGRSAGANFSSQVQLPPTPGETSGVYVEMTSPTSAPSLANTFAIFACDSIQLNVQYPVSFFVGTNSGTDHESSMEANGSAAAGFVQADAVARPADGPALPGPYNGTSGAENTFQSNKRGIDRDGDHIEEERRPQ